MKHSNKHGGKVLALVAASLLALNLTSAFAQEKTLRIAMTARSEERRVGKEC